MSNTIVYSDYNKYPGLNTSNSKTYDFTAGRALPVLPDVNLYNNFDFKIYATSANAVLPPTTNTTNAKDWWQNPSAYKSGVAPNSSEYGYAGAEIIKIVTGIEWIKGGPNGNGICFNEKGDWFSEATLGTADSEGGGVKFTVQTYPGQTIPFTHVTSTSNYSSLLTITIPKPPNLRIAGAYNGAVFCYNKFDYTNDDKGTVFTAKSLYELPEKFDNLVSFIPDQREKTTLTYTVKVYWERYIDWGIWSTIFSTNKKNEILNNYTNNGFGASGYDIHTITHVVKNTNPNWGKILKEILKERQRSLSEQDERYGQTFPTQEINVGLPTAAGSVPTVSGVTNVITNADGSTTTLVTDACGCTTIVNTTASGVSTANTVFVDGKSVIK